MLIYVKYLHDQELCYKAVWSKEKQSNVSSRHEQMACERSYKSRCTFGQITPSEAALKQHSLRASLQTQIWTVAEPHIPSPLEYRWQDGKDSLQPVYSEGPVSAGFLQDIVCSCEGKSHCKQSCVFFEANVHVHNYASANCQNGANMHKRIHWEKTQVRYLNNKRFWKLLKLPLCLCN